MDFGWRRLTLKVRMIGPFVPRPESPASKIPDAQGPRPNQGPGPRMDPLSEVLSLLKTQSYSSGGFAMNGDIAIHFPNHQGIKCYAMLAGQCWLVVEGTPERSEERRCGK